MKQAKERGLLLSWENRSSLEPFFSRLTGVRWSKLDAERIQSLEGVLYNLVLVLPVGWSIPASVRDVARDTRRRSGLESQAFDPN